MKKVFVGSLLSLVAVFGLSFQAPSASASGNESANSIVEKSADVYISQQAQTVEEIRLDEIDAKYEVGEELSKEDAEFIKQLAKEKEEAKSENQIMAQNTFTGQGNNPNKTITSLSLGQFSDKLGYFNHSYTLSVTTKMNKGKATKIENKYKYTAYGVIGSGGVGKVYTNSDSSSCKSQSCYSYFNEKYSAWALYSSASVTAKVTYGSGSSFTYTMKGL